MSQFINTDISGGTGSFIQRLIEISVKLAEKPGTNQPPKFAESGTNTVTLSGFRVSTRVQNSGAPVGTTATVDIFGLSKSLMDQMSTLGIAFNVVPRNTLTIMAGDASGLVPVFSGTITASYGQYDMAPEVPFHFECNSGLADATAPAAVSSFPGPTDVATIMSGLARQMNLGFENNGVNVKLSSPYLSGTLLMQMRECADHAGINAEIINGNLLAIWPKGGNRATQTVPVISPETGMIGYPAYTQQGIIVRSIFVPQISFGSLIEVKSSLKAASGTWAINKLDLALDSMVQGGQWMSTIYAYNPKYPRPIPNPVG